jgi:DNA-binding response OmpR family regulator
MCILVVEDNRRLSAALARALEDSGYAVDAAYDGTEGQELAESAPYDAVILDIMLPGRNGLTVCRALRDRRMNAPILMLTARDTVTDRVRGLDSGADDYLVKPFALSELLARLRAVLRRDGPDRHPMLRAGDITLDPATHAIERRGQHVELSPRLFALLELLMRHPNQILTRETIAAHIWSYDYEGVSNVVDVYVRRLRRALDDPFDDKVVETIRGMGYRLRVPKPQ